VRDGTALTVWGDGHATKDYLFFDDLLSALALAFKHRLHGTFNVASERSVSLREIIALAGNEAGRDLEVRETPHFPWDVERTAISAGKFRLATGWCARTDALEAIRELIKTELAQCR
jgi:UDP-glucose 4-epimerase